MTVKDKVRVNVYLPQPIIYKIDEFANALGSNRSVMIATICKQYIDQQAALSISPDLLEKLQGLVEAVKK